MTAEDWGQGYDAGNAGLIQAIKTAEWLMLQRIIKYIDLNSPMYPSKHEVMKLIKNMPVD